MPTRLPVRVASRIASRLTAATAAAGLALAAAPPPAAAYRIKAPPPAGSTVADFGLDAYAQLSAKDGNLAFSPISLYLALAILEQGSDDQDADAIASALHLPRKTDTDTLAAVEKQLTAMSGVHIGNGLWVARGNKLKSSYASKLKKALRAEIASMDFSRGEKARRTINQWIGKRTDGAIKNLVPKGMIDASTLLVLASAIHFVGTWHDAFDKSKTSDGDFHLADGTTASVPMMRRSGAASLAVTNDASMLELPYDSGLVMDVVVPADGVALGDLEHGIATRFPTWSAALTNQSEVAITLPRFHVDQQVDLPSLLRGMGLGLLFDGFHLSNMLTRSPEVQISAAYHQTVVDVDEKGTVASAATVIGIRPTMVRQTPTFTADRPFLWIVRDPSSGAILFMGRVADPR